MKKKSFIPTREAMLAHAGFVWWLKHNRVDFDRLTDRELHQLWIQYHNKKKESE